MTSVGDQVVEICYPGITQIVDDFLRKSGCSTLAEFERIWETQLPILFEELKTISSFLQLNDEIVTQFIWIKHHEYVAMLASEQPICAVCWADICTCFDSDADGPTPRPVVMTVTVVMKKKLLLR